MTIALVRSELLYAWAGPSLLITNTRGDCGPDQWLSGFYYREARFLRTLRLAINAPHRPRAAVLAAEVVVRGLRVGEAVVSVRFDLDEHGRSEWEILHRKGTVHVLRMAAPESLSPLFTLMSLRALRG